jgi:hypothetical protein
MHTFRLARVPPFVLHDDQVRKDLLKSLRRAA